MKNKLEKKIEKALNAKFPGLKARFKIAKTGSCLFEMRRGSKKRFYDLYPGMSQEQADDQLLADVQETIWKYLPDTIFLGYERHGQYTHKMTDPLRAI